MTTCGTAPRTCSPLDTATGEVLGECYPRRRAEEFLKFMDAVVKRYPDREIHVVLDNLSTHSGGDVDTWLAKHPNITFHFTPTGSSWLNQVEVWFPVISPRSNVLIGIRQDVRLESFNSGIVSDSDGKVVLNLIQQDTSLCRCTMRVGALIANPVTDAPEPGSPVAVVTPPTP